VPEEEVQPPVDRLSFREGEQPIAFGQLLETPIKDSAAAEAPAIEPVEPVSDDQVLTSARDANLGEPVFWKAEEPEAEAEEGQAEGEEENSRDFSQPWGLGEASLRDHAEHGASGKAHAEMAVEPVQPVESIEPEPLELVRDETDESAAPSVVEASSLVAQDAAAQASLTVQSGRAEDLAANPLEWMATAPAQHSEEAPEETETAWNAEESASEENSEGHETGEEAGAPMKLAPATTLPPPPPLGVIPAPSLLGMPKPPAAPQAAPPTPSQAKTSAPVIEPRKTPLFKPQDHSAEDTARSIPKQDWADLAAGLDFKPAPPVEKPKTPQIPAAAPPSSSPVASNSAAMQSEDSANSAPDPALVEAVVQRVLDKMRPQVVDIITKEFLRPVVQALVHREITKH